VFEEDIVALGVEVAIGVVVDGGLHRVRRMHAAIYLTRYVLGSDFFFLVSKADIEWVFSGKS
jgi:hypothetical protein